MYNLIKKIIYFAVSFAFAFFAAVVIFLISLLASESGSGWLMKQLASYDKGVISYQSFQGKILGDFSFQGLRFQTKNLQLNIPQLIWQWQPIKLLKAQLVIDNIKLDSPTLHFEPAFFDSDDHASEFSLPKLALPWWLNTLQINSLQLNNWQITQHYHLLAQSRSTLLQAAVNHSNMSFTLQNSHLIINQGDRKYPKLWQLESILSVKGQAKHYQWTLKNQVLMPEAKKAVDWNFAGDGGVHQFHLAKINSQYWPNDLNVDALLAWQHQVDLFINLHGKLNSKLWDSSLNGELLGDINFNIEKIATPAMFAHIDINKLQGNLFDQIVAGQGHVQWSHGEAIVNGLVIKVGQNYLTASGLISKNSNFKWQINVLDFKKIIPEFGGSVKSKGILQGDWQQPQLDMSAVAKNLKLKSLIIGDLDANAAIGGESQRFEASVITQGLIVSNYGIKKLQFNSSGTFLSHQIKFSSNSQDGQLNLLLHGKYQNSSWQGKLLQLTIKPAQLESWQLKNPISFMVAQHLLQMPAPLCLVQGNQHICAQVNLNEKKQRSLKLDTSKINLKAWSALLPDTIVVSHGQIAVQADVNFDKRWQPFGNANIKLWPTTINYQISDQQNLPIQIDHGEIRADFNNQVAQVNANIKSNLGDGSLLVAAKNWQEHAHDWEDQAINGQLNWQIINLKWVQNVFPTLQNTQGTLKLKADISGLITKPNADINLHLSNGAALLVPYNLNLKNITLQLQGMLDKVLQVSGGIDSGSGRLNIKGKLSNVLAGSEFDLNLIGKDILLTNLPSYIVWGNPDVKLSYAAHNMKLEGKLEIPKADIRIVDYGDQAVSVSNDVVFVDEETSMLNFFTDLKLKLGDDIKFKYGGLVGKLRGKLNLVDAPGVDTTATGEINLVDGSYQAYGQELQIKQAQASFKGGSVSDPTLNVEAVKVLKNVVPLTPQGNMLSGATVSNPDGSLTVGIKIYGLLSHYQVRMFSIPTGLSQSDILSYLILGQPVSQAGSGGGQLLLSAAAALSNGNSTSTINKLQNDLQNALGVQVSVGTASQYNPTTQSVSQGTAVILTKALSPKLYLSYSMGIGQAVSVLNLRYQISRRWMAQTETSALGNGGDLFYTINSKAE